MRLHLSDGFCWTAAFTGRGIGSAMMRELFDALKKASFRSIRLGFVEGNSESEGFWRSLGFSPTGKKSPQEAYTVVVAARDLD